MTLRLTLAVAIALAMAPTRAGAAPPCGQAGVNAGSAPAAAAHQHDATPPVGQAGTQGQGGAVATTAPSELDQVLTKIDQATGEAKVSLIVTLLKRLAADHQPPMPTAGTHAAGPTAAEAHGSACPMCAAHKAGQAPSDAETHAPHGGFESASTSCGMTPEKK